VSIRLRRTDGPAPARPVYDEHPLDSHAARAALVDYIATLRRYDDIPAVEIARGQIADDLSAILRRWDIAGAHRQGAEPCQ
jgi:hypothetical protein